MRKSEKRLRREETEKTTITLLKLNKLRGQKRDMNNECCGTCQYHVSLDEEWICDNKESDGYGCPTAFDDVCGDYEGRE